MSSFLDSTGLSRLVSKITDYFAKKDGTYPDMTVGNISNVVPIAKLPTASSVTSNDTTHVPTVDAVYKYAAWSAKGKGNVAVITKPLNEIWQEINLGIFDLEYAVNSTIVSYRIVIRCEDSISSSAPFGKAGFVQIFNRSTGAGSNIVKYTVENGILKIGFRISSTERVQTITALGQYPATMFISTGELPYWSDYTPTTFHDVFKSGENAVGSTSQPVYVDSSGEVKPCYVVRRYSSWANSVRFTKSLSTAWNDGQSVVITSAAWRHHKTMFSVSFVISGTITESNPLGTEGSVRIVRMNNNIGNPPNIYYRVTNGEVEFVIHGMNGLTTNCAIYVDEYGISTTLSADWSSSGYSLITNPTRLTANFTTF